LTRAIWYKENYVFTTLLLTEQMSVMLLLQVTCIEKWRPYMNYTFDGRNGYSINVTLPTPNNFRANNIRAVREGHSYLAAPQEATTLVSPVVPGVMCVRILTPLKVT
jgi:hypothetical protein